VFYVENEIKILKGSVVILLTIVLEMASIQMHLARRLAVIYGVAENGGHIL
jgi:hypothetical protein